MTLTTVHVEVVRKIAEKYGVPEFNREDWKGIFYEPVSKVLIDSQHPSKEYPGLPTIGISNLIETDENAGGQTIDTIRSDIRTAFDALPKEPIKTKEKFKPKVIHDSKTQGQEYKGAIPGTSPEVPKVDFTPKERPIAPLIDDLKNKEKKDEPPKIETKKANPIPEKVQEVKHDESKTTKAQEGSPPNPKSPEPEQAKPIKPAEQKTIPVKNCKICGFELSHKRAMDCYLSETGFICEECEAKKPDPIKTEVMPVEPKWMSRQAPARVPVISHTQQGTMIKGIAPSLAEIGKIKIGKKGEMKTSAGGAQFRMPVKLDHFEITSIIKDEKTGQFIPDPIMKSLGESPTELDIQLLFNDPTLNFVTSYGQYQGGRCMCRGDGESAKLPDGSIVECNPEVCPQFAAKKCKPNGVLSVILSKSPRLGGVYKFRTTSINSIKSILSSMFFLATQTGGVLSMIPLKLTLSPKQVTPIVKGVPTPSTIYVVNIEYAGTVEDLLNKTIEVQTYQSKMRENLVKLEATARNILTAPEAPEDQKDFQQEYYPEAE